MRTATNPCERSVGVHRSCDEQARFVTGRGVAREIANLAATPGSGELSKRLDEHCQGGPTLGAGEQAGPKVDVLAQWNRRWCWQSGSMR